MTIEELKNILRVNNGLRGEEVLAAPEVRVLPFPTDEIIIAQAQLMTYARVVEDKMRKAKLDPEVYSDLSWYMRSIIVDAMGPLEVDGKPARTFEDWNRSIATAWNAIDCVRNRIKEMEPKKDGPR